MRAVLRRADSSQGERPFVISLSRRLINRDTDYAVRALRCMAQRLNEVVSVGELAPELDVPRPYLRRILQTLAQHDVLSSYRGRGAGSS